MSKYCIDQTGIDSCNQLASDMTSVSKNIENCGIELKGKIAGISEGLGVYEEDIKKLVNDISKELEKGKGPLLQLSKKAKQLAVDIKNMLHLES